MTEPRLELVTPCEHGMFDRHPLSPTLDPVFDCRGGGRRLINIDYEAAANALVAHAADRDLIILLGGNVATRLAREAVDAALGLDNP